MKTKIYEEIVRENGGEDLERDGTCDRWTSVQPGGDCNAPDPDDPETLAESYLEGDPKAVRDAVLIYGIDTVVVDMTADAVSDLSGRWVAVTDDGMRLAVERIVEAI